MRNSVAGEDQRGLGEASDLVAVLVAVLVAGVMMDKH
jgi:hypothetical protein